MKRSLVFSNGINGIFELGFLGNLDGFPFFSCRIVSSLSSRQNGQVPFSSID
jgi:hypothetical protein